MLVTEEQTCGKETGGWWSFPIPVWAAEGQCLLHSGCLGTGWGWMSFLGYVEFFC